MSTSQPGILPQVFIETQAGSNWKRQVWAGTSLAATETRAYSPVSIIPGERHCDATHGGRGRGGGGSLLADFKGTSFSSR